jgi:signal transduction histidine kinase
LENLLANAWKYTRRCEHARIRFTSHVENNTVVYSISDNGAGFDMAYADKLFKPFDRLHRPEEFEGTGIGLAIVARIVQRHGGRIWARAEVDRGATFSFTLPGN